MPATYEPIATYTIPSAQASYTFTGISGAYTDIVLIAAGTDSTASALSVQVGNGSIDTGSNYSATIIYGAGTSGASYRQTSSTTMDLGLSGTNQNVQIIQFMNYSNTTTYKTVIGRGNNTPDQTRASVGLWRNTAAINQIKVAGTSFQTGTTITLYGIKAA